MTHDHDTTNKQTNGNMRKWATYASISVAITLIIAKFAGFLITDSVAMLSSLVDSAVDFLASTITLRGVRRAMQPPDRGHRFGHGKAEPLAALLQAAFIVGSALLLAGEAVDRFVHPQSVQESSIGIAIMVLAIVLTVALVTFQRYVVMKTKSVAIDADRLHYLSDLFLNLAVGASLILGEFTGATFYDPLFALLVTGILLHSAAQISRQSLHILMDHELPEEERAQIREAVLAQKGVRGLHDLRTRSDGEYRFIELHLEMDGQMLLRVAHATGDAVERSICSIFPNAQVLIHHDPEGLNERRLDEVIQASK